MRSIRCSNKREALVRRLAVDMFPTLREVMCFAAVLGFSKGPGKPLSAEQKDIVDSRIFQSSAEAMEALYMIGVAHGKGLEMLRPSQEDALVECFERYAETGLEFVEDVLAGTATETETVSRLSELLIKEYAPVSGLSEGDPHDTEF